MRVAMLVRVLAICLAWYERLCCCCSFRVTMFWRSVALTLDCCVCVRRRRVDSGFSPQRSITASRRSVVFEIACLHNRNNKHRLTFCHVAFANLCSSRRHHRADRVARRALCEILASRYYHRRVQGAAFEVTVETGSCRRSLAALSLTRLAPTLSRAQVLLDRDMPNPATMKLYHEELQAMVLAVDSELPALHETGERRSNASERLARRRSRSWWTAELAARPVTRTRWPIQSTRAARRTRSAPCTTAVT